VEAGAGAKADFSDDSFKAVGASIVSKDEAITSDLVLKVRPPSLEEVAKMKEQAGLISFLYPATNKPLIEAL